MNSKTSSPSAAARQLNTYESAESITCGCAAPAHAAQQLGFLSCASRSTTALWFPRVTAHGSRSAALIRLQSQGVQGERRRKDTDRKRERVLLSNRRVYSQRQTLLRNAKMAKRMWPNTWVQLHGATPTFQLSLCFSHTPRWVNVCYGSSNSRKASTSNCGLLLQHEVKSLHLILARASYY